jgi:hypothetical protein
MFAQVPRIPATPGMRRRLGQGAGPGQMADYSPAADSVQLPVRCPRPRGLAHSVEAGQSPQFEGPAMEPARNAREK